MQLYCKKCNHKLTVSELQLAKPGEANMDDQADLIGPGLYLKASEIDIHFEQSIDFLLNKKSVKLQNHKDRKRLQGCCGPGDLSVLNQVCPTCSAEIGVLVADCWFPHFVGICGGAVSEEALW